MLLTIEPAQPGDLPDLLALLEASGLPQAGFSDHLAMALAARDGDALVGCATLEMYGASALLRSVAVRLDWQGKGLGRRLTQAALNLAREQGVERVYLLTETAGDFFPRFGFQTVARAAVPPEVQQSVEFTSACPTSALVMVKGVDHDGGRPTRVLILCTGNSARSQMAEALLRARGGHRFEVYSAGVAPKGVHPLAVQAMAEVGIDISGARSKGVTEFLGQPMDYVITVCDHANETCPVFPGAVTRLHHSFEDPAAVPGDEAARLAVFRRVRDELDEWLKDFASHL